MYCLHSLFFKKSFCCLFVEFKETVASKSSVVCKNQYQNLGLEDTVEMSIKTLRFDCFGCHFLKFA